MDFAPVTSAGGFFFARIAHQSGANSAASTVNGGKACYANFVCLRLLRLPCSLLLPHLPVTAMAIRVAAISMVYKHGRHVKNNWDDRINWNAPFRGRWWGGRWYGYGEGACWQWTPGGYIWICR